MPLHGWLQQTLYIPPRGTLNNLFPWLAKQDSTCVYLPIHAAVCLVFFPFFLDFLSSMYITYCGCLAGPNARAIRNAIRDDPPRPEKELNPRAAAGFLLILNNLLTFSILVVFSAVSLCSCICYSFFPIEASASVHLVWLTCSTHKYYAFRVGSLARYLAIQLFS